MVSGLVVCKNLESVIRKGFLLGSPAPTQITSIPHCFIRFGWFELERFINTSTTNKKELRKRSGTCLQKWQFGKRSKKQLSFELRSSRFPGVILQIKRLALFLPSTKSDSQTWQCQSSGTKKALLLGLFQIGCSEKPGKHLWYAKIQLFFWDANVEQKISICSPTEVREF